MNKTPPSPAPQESDQPLPKPDKAMDKTCEEVPSPGSNQDTLLDLQAEDTSSSRKRTYVELETHSDSDDLDHLTDDEKALNHSVVVPRVRQAKRRASERQEILQSDKHTLQVEAGRVRCKGCRKWIALATNRNFDLKNWNSHKQVCPQITGKDVVRVKRARPDAKFSTVSLQLMSKTH